jgi:hypothetical protein
MPGLSPRAFTGRLAAGKSMSKIPQLLYHLEPHSKGKR